ncbi:hypothetical protein JM654_03945 [Microbacterium oxydans]|nr:hypothetical protein [Microbacterium oxydans]
MAGKRKITRRFIKLRDEFREQCREEHAACWLCGQDHIDYDAPARRLRERRPLRARSLLPGVDT